MAVLFGHYLTSRGVNLGRFGVELFFVLSGRLMAEILFVRDRPLTSFYLRRFSRIYPALLVLALCMLCLSFALHHKDPTSRQFLSVATLTYNYTWPFLGRSSVLAHTWSLCVEEHMYLLLGAVAFLCRRSTQLSPIALLVALILVALTIGTIQTLQGWDYYSVYWRSDTRGASILIGAVAYLMLRDPIPRWLSASYVPIAAGLIGLALNMNAVPDPVKYSLGTASLAISLTLLHRAPQALREMFEHKLTVLTGTVSYSLYLWQQPFYKAGQGIPERLLLLPLGLLAATCSYRLIEQPARSFLNAFFQTHRSRIQGSASLITARWRWRPRRDSNTQHPA